VISQVSVKKQPNNTLRGLLCGQTENSPIGASNAVKYFKICHATRWASFWQDHYATHAGKPGVLPTAAEPARPQIRKHWQQYWEDYWAKWYNPKTTESERIEMKKTTGSSHSARMGNYSDHIQPYNGLKTNRKPLPLSTEATGDLRKIIIIEATDGENTIYYYSRKGETVLPPMVAGERQVQGFSPWKYSTNSWGNSFWALDSQTHKLICPGKSGTDCFTLVEIWEKGSTTPNADGPLRQKLVTMPFSQGNTSV
jgi:hypothetical protein